MRRGTVYLGGGGSEDEEWALWSIMLQRRPRVLYWPFALPREALVDAQTWLRRSLDAHAATLSLTTWTSLAGHHPGELVDYDLLFVGGGNTYRLLHEISRHGFADAVRAFIGCGGDYYGGSAGAILAGESIAIAGWYDVNDTDQAELAGLGLLAGVEVLPHFDRTLESRARRWSALRRVPVLGIPESCGVLVHGNSLTVAGPESAWSLTAAGTVEHPAGAEVSSLDLGPEIASSEGTDQVRSGPS